LNDRITKLENEKEGAETKEQFEKKIEIIEEAWQCETRELIYMMSRLQTENEQEKQIHVLRKIITNRKLDEISRLMLGEDFPEGYQL